MLKLDETNSKIGKILYLFFSIVQIWVLKVNIFLKYFLDNLHLESGSVDPDPGSQNLADPTDPGS